MESRRNYFQDLDEESGNATQRLLNSDSKEKSFDLDRKEEREFIYSKVEDSSEVDFVESTKGPNCICIGFVTILLLSITLWCLSFLKLFIEFASTDKEIDKFIALESRRFQFDDIYNTSFAVKKANLVWVENDPRDGIYTYRDSESNDILLESIENKSTSVFVQAIDLKTKNGLLDVESFELSYDSEYLLLKTNVTSQWRHSTLYNPYIYQVSNKKITQLIKPSSNETQLNKISYAVWSPTGHQLAYVYKNDIYITDLKSHKRITFDGSQTIFNGIPDWVYEEEILASNYALWWAPDSTHIAYLKLDETNVPEFNLQLYTTNKNSTYPTENKIRYPKAGSPNPLVSLHVYSIEKDYTITATTDQSTFDILKNYSDFEENDRLIVDVTWATDSHTHLLFKQMNRIQNEQYTNLLAINTQAIEKSTVSLVREYKPTDGGWIDVTQSMVYLPNQKSDTLRYLDILDNKEGFSHLAIVTVSKEGRQKGIDWLTSGEWEVLSETVKVDPKRQLIHFISTERSPHERHLYRISLKDKKPANSKICMTCPEDPKVHAYYSASFSPKFGYYILDYLGPDVPYTTVKKVDDHSFEHILQDNKELKEILKGIDLPKIHMKTVTSGGVEMTAMEMVPFDFDINKKYPVLFHVYGGPGSQLVSYKFSLDWQTYVAGQMGYVVVTVDGRGTGFRGRKYRVGVCGRLGQLETIDQVNAGRHWSTLEYVDESRMAIWGWSYGGYMTSKVIEANDGVFSTGMAVAPVTDWLYYDSVYTERYMKTPILNPSGYETSAVNNMTGFKNAKYLLAHGTGDDNVHFQHTAVLIDKLTLADVHDYRVQIYADSNHAIKYHNANKNIYYLLTKFLYESFGGHEYQHVYTEMNGKFSGPLHDDH